MTRHPLISTVSSSASLAALSLLLLACAPGCGGRQAASTEEPTTEVPAEGETAAEARPCGTRGTAQCEEGEFCLFPDRAQCGAADHPGTCQPIPQRCTREFRPVCGCGDRTFPNRCAAHAAGTSVAHEGACADGPPGGTRVGGDGPGCVRGGCGGELCQSVDAESMASICVARPEHACFRAADCEQQADGSCGFTQTPELEACLQSPPAL